MWPCPIALLAIEILNERAERVQIRARSVPAHKYFSRVRAQMKRKHLFLVVHVNFDLFGSLGMGNGITVADFDFCAIFAADAEEGSDDALLVRVTSE